MTDTGNSTQTDIYTDPVEYDRPVGTIQAWGTTLTVWEIGAGGERDLVVEFHGRFIPLHRGGFPTLQEASNHLQRGEGDHIRQAELWLGEAGL